MPLVHVSDIEPMADHIRANIVRYLMQNHNIESLDDNAERDMYNFILLTIQNYMLNPPANNVYDDSPTKRLGWYLALPLAILAVYCLSTTTTAI
jgi:hypothetical protein